MMLFYLPDIIVFRICDFMEITDMIRLSDSDYRIKTHLDIKHKYANVIKKSWKRMITRGRDYGMKEFEGFCSINSMNRMVAQLCCIVNLPSIKFHTAYPRHRIIIPKHEFTDYIMCSTQYNLLCEFTLIPPADLYIRSSRNRRFKVTNESVIPICAMPFDALYFEPKPETRYICYTGVLLPFAFSFENFSSGPIECVNMDAYMSCGTINTTKQKFVRKNPSLIPTRINNEDW